MTAREMIIAGGSMTAVAAGAAALWTISWQRPSEVAQGTGRSPGDARPPAQEVSMVCVGRDRIVRSPSADGKCPPDHEEIPLENDDSGICELCDPFGDPPPAPSRSSELDAVNERLTSLERTPYFEVVDKRDSPIFRVSADGVRVFNRQGLPLVAIGTLEAGGFFTARSTALPTDIAIGATDNTAGLRIRESGLLRADLSAKNAGESLRFPSAIGLIAGMGESNAGTGTLLLGNLQGQVKVKFTVPDGRAILDVMQNDKGGVALAEAKIGGGMLDVGDRAGNSAVRMGHNAQKYGVVLAGPVLGLPLVPRSGLPGSYFMGCANGESVGCVGTIDMKSVQ